MKAHRAVVAELGPTPLHRLSFDAPCYAEFGVLGHPREALVTSWRTPLGLRV